MTRMQVLSSSIAQARKWGGVALLLGVGLGHGPAGWAQSLAPAQAPVQNWSFKGPLGHFDLAAVQRGYAVFAGVCASCHGLTQVHFSDLAGMGLTSEQIAALAEAWQVPYGLDAEGRLKHRKAQPDDALPEPYPNAQAARSANRGAVPPDLSRITQVYPGGPDRVFALLTGYGAPPSHQNEKGALLAKVGVEGLTLQAWRAGRAALPTPMPLGTALPCPRLCEMARWCMPMAHRPLQSRKRAMSPPFWRGFPTRMRTASAGWVLAWRCICVFSPLYL